MDILVSLLFFCLCVYFATRMLKPLDAVDFQMGIIGVFSVGYFCLPIWFKSFSNLKFYPESSIAAAGLIFFLFALFVCIGVTFGRKIVTNKISIKTKYVDGVFLNHTKKIAIIAFIFALYQTIFTDITVYTANDRDIFLNDRNFIDSFISLIGDVSLAFICWAFSNALLLKRKSEVFLFGVMLLFATLSLVFVGQRLAVITPFIMLIAALLVSGQANRAKVSLVFSIGVLLFLSPVAVFVRESIADQSAADSGVALTKFEYSDDPIMQSFQSIIDRADLIYVALEMKPELDEEPTPSLIYYLSVLANPIPAAVFPGEKPFPLSTNGSPSGELSIYASTQIAGNPEGSLTAFGGLVAYREGSWVGVIVNGLMTGILFVAFARWLTGGSFVFQLIYIRVFVAISVSKVPPSFMEALLALVPFIPLMVIAVLLNSIFMIGGRRREMKTFTAR